MLKRGFTNILIVPAILLILFCAFAARQANAIVIFDFVGTCDNNCTIALPNSTITAQLQLADAALTNPSFPNFLVSDILSLSLTLEIATGVFDMFFIGPDPMGPPPQPFFLNPASIAGTLSPAGDSILNITVRDSIGQGFQVIFGVDAASRFTLRTGATDRGVPIFFMTPKEIPEPNSTLMFLLAALSLMFTARRQTPLAAVARH